MIRRQILKAAGLLSITGAALNTNVFAAAKPPTKSKPAKSKSTKPSEPGKVIKIGRLKQSVSQWCYGKLPLEELCKAAADMGLHAIDLLEEKDWETPAKFGLICSMAYGGGGSIPDGLNNKANHDAIVK